LHANGEKSVFNMVVEIPRWTNAKLEVRWLSDHHSDTAEYMLKL
jgi:inorganic pyrophosphatase